MAIAERSAVATWEGSLATGSGTIRPATGALGELPVTWASRTEQPGGKTSPEELAAAARFSCFAMALALRLGERKAAPQRLTVTATVTLDEAGGLPTITSSDVRIRAQVRAWTRTVFRRPSRRRPACARYPGSSPGPRSP